MVNMRCVVAIDPGIYNYGWAVLDLDTEELVAHGVHCMKRRGDGDAAIVANIVSAVCTMVQTYAPVAAVVENQGQSMILKGIQQATVAAFCAYGVVSYVIFPQTVKSHFKEIGLGFHGHAQNKLDAEAAMLILGYPKCVHHVADCILMATYWRQIQ